MRTQISFIICVVLCIGLGTKLFLYNKRTNEQFQEDMEIILYRSNQLVETSSKLDAQIQVNMNLANHLRISEVLVSNLSSDLTLTSQNLSKTEAALKTALEENAKRDAKIAELESQKETLDKQAVDLKLSIGSLETQIADTQKKITSSEGDKAFLGKELNRLVAEKAELERQFNDLAVLRVQVHKLKEELSIARRLEWIRQGLFASQEQKDAQKLMQWVNTTPKYSNTNKYDLNVEVNADGSVKVIEPVTNNNEPTQPPRGEFPWPVPKYTCLEQIPTKLIFRDAEKETLEIISQRLASALALADYAKYTFYSISTNGFAMVTQLEQIYSDGSFVKPPNRWASNIAPPVEFNLAWYLRAVFTCNPGYYRVIVFVVTDQPISESNTGLTEKTAGKLLSGGTSVINKSIGPKHYDNNYRCTALVYEFVRKSKTDEPVLLSGSVVVGAGKTHLKQSSIMSALESVK